MNRSTEDDIGAIVAGIIVLAILAALVYEVFWLGQHSSGCAGMDWFPW